MEITQASIISHVYIFPAVTLVQYILLFYWLMNFILDAECAVICGPVVSSWSVTGCFRVQQCKEIYTFTQLFYQTALPHLSSVCVCVCVCFPISLQLEVSIENIESLLSYLNEDIT